MQLAERLRYGVRGGYDRQVERALQFHRDWGGRYGARFTHIAGREGQPVWHYRRGRGSVLHDRTGRERTNIDWVRNGIQADGCGRDQDHDYAHVFAESVHFWAGGDLYRGGHFQAPRAAGRRIRLVHERHDVTGNGDVEWRLGQL